MHRNKSPKKTKKFRLLFDSALPKPSQLSKLSSKAHLEHVVYTFGMSRASEDKFIYQKATENNCFVVTVDEDFKKLVKRNQAGAIIIPPDLSVMQLEEILIIFISGKDPEEFKGKATKLLKF